MVALFNWKDEPQTLPFPLPEASYINRLLDGRIAWPARGVFTVKDMPAHSASFAGLQAMSKSSIDFCLCLVIALVAESSDTD